MDTYEILLRVKRTLAQMMRDRGFGLTADAAMDASIPLAFEYDDLLSFFKRVSARKKADMSLMDALGDVFERPSHTEIAPGVPGRETWYAVFSMNTKSKRLGINDVLPFLAFLDEKNADGGILITNLALTTQARDALEVVRGRRIQHFTFDELMYNPTHHVFTPMYRHISNPEEIAAFYKKERVHARQMPRMTEGDPIARYFGAKTGDLFEEVSETRSVPQMIQKTATVRLVA
jgi:DNA-directed RNA polymerase I, II, and III subunit RPABC1